MPKIIASVTQRFLPRARRLLSSRPSGSILIMVVAVLVLLALMGTAYISVVRLDRQAAEQINRATPSEVIDELLPAIEDSAKRVIAEDVVTLTQGYRPPLILGVSTYDHWDCPITNYFTDPGMATGPLALNDAWLGTRLPEELSNPNWPPNQRVVTWRVISRPITQAAIPASGAMPPEKMFFSPYADPTITLTGPTNPQALVKYPQWTQNALTQRMAISELTITYPKPFSETSLEGKTRVFPALIPVTLTGDPMPNTLPAPQRLKYLAGDADGDGIADCGLVPIQDNDIGGVRYFYGIRIVDHGSAINVNTARARSGDFAEGATAPNLLNRALFPANIGLAELPLVTYNPGTGLSSEMDELNRFRFGYVVGDMPPFSLNLSHPWEEWPPNNPPVDRAADFIFISQGDADWAMRAMRLDGPGIRNPQTPSNMTDDLKYRAFSWADASSLAFHGGTMMVPRSSDPQTGRPSGDLERAFYDGGLVPTTPAPDSIYRGAANYLPTQSNRFTFFPPDKSAYWYRYSLDFGPNRTTLWTPTETPDASGTAPALPMRVLLTTHNGVSNSINVHAEAAGNIPNEAMLPYNHKGRWSPYRGYAGRDIVIWGLPGAAHPPTPPVAYAPTAAYICLAAYTKAQADAELPEPLETRQPVYAAPTANWARIIPRGIHIPGGAYAVGHAVTTTLLSGARQVYICTNVAGTATMPPSADWYTLPLAETPPKVSLNTAPFSELFRGFYNVMADMSPLRTPFDGVIATAITGMPPAAVRPNGPPGMPGTFNDPYVGNRFMDQAALPVPFDRVAGPPPEPIAHPGAMLRSPIRAIPNVVGTYTDAQPRLPADQVLLLRAAIAAVNAEDMRDRDMNVTARLVHLQAYFGAGTVDRQAVNAVVYGSEPQPFITEVFASNDPRTNGAGVAINPNGYVAIELHNPYPFPISMDGYRIVAIDRDGVTAGPGAEVYLTQDPGPLMVVNFDPTAPAPDFFVQGGGPAVIPPGGYMILENCAGATAGPPGAGERPESSGLPPAPAGNPALGAVVTVYCPGLGDAGVRTVMNREIQLVKRRNWDATPSVGVYDVPAGAGGVDYNDNSLVNPNWLLDMVPVDAFDFTGLPAPLITPGPREEWHYRRQTSGGPWRFVYPGRYDGSLSTPGRPRQAGVQSAEWDTFVTPGSLSPWTGVPPATLAMSLGQSYIGAAYVPATCDNPDASYPRPFTIQWANGNFDAAAGDPGAFVGINRTGAGVNLFPFGGFMRNGDVLSVPFIGAYCIRPVPAPPAPIAVPPSPGPLWFFEMNPVTMDAAMAEDGEWMNDPDLAPAVPTGAYDEYREQLGRFFPPSNPTAMPASAYEWASDILDQFTVQNPHDDFLANVDPTRYPVPGGGVRTPGVASDGGAAANTENDQEIPIEGLINVNTASAKVLSQLPLVVDPATGSVNVNQTERLAQSIVYFRDVDQGNGQPYGPFKNLFELNRVTDVAAPAQGFRNMLGNMVDNGDSDDNQGDYSPLGAALDGVAMDYEERYGNLMRLSNLMTTRSDVFTVYVLVQGWKNVGSPYPVLVAERRSAFIADRTRINSVNSAVDTVPVPTR